jgi:hypothetical protein
VQRVELTPETSPRKLKKLVADAGVVQYSEALTIRGRDHGRPSRLRWRSLLAYVWEEEP